MEAVTPKRPSKVRRPNETTVIDAKTNSRTGLRKLKRGFPSAGLVSQLPLLPPFGDSREGAESQTEAGAALTKRGTYPPSGISIRIGWFTLWVL